MHFKITLKLRQVLQFVCLISLFAFSFNQTKAQGTITTSSTPTSGIAGGSAGITFNIENTNATARVLSRVNVYWDPAVSTSPSARLWVTTTNLSGTGPIASPAWTQITGFVPITVTAAGIIPTFTNLNYTLAANTKYRFAVESTDGIKYGNAATTPNTMNVDGVALQTGNFQIAAQNVGYAVNPFPILLNNPRFFAGSVTFVTAIACAGTPIGGNTVSSVIGSCTSAGFDISTSTTPTVGTTGVSYQLQSSSTTGGTFTNVGAPSQIPTFFNVTQTTANAYRIVATCANGGGTVTFAAVFVPLSTVCYCAAGSTLTVQSEKISNVTFAGINRNTPATNNAGYISYLSDTAKVIQGATYPVSITGNALTYPGDVVAVWIDFNQNGTFTDPGENVYISGESAGPYTGNIMVPASALLGNTRMRVRLYDNQFGNGVNGPCGSNTYGVVQDFTVKVNPCIPITFTSQPTAQTTTCGGNATFTAAVSGSLPAYQWQFRTSQTGVFQNVPNSAPYSGANTATLTISNIPTSFSGYEYRLSISGPCTGANASSAATLTVTPYIPAISPTPAILCAGSSLQIFASPPPATTTATSAANLNITIPDGVRAGINNSLTIAGIPAGANVNNITIKINSAHNYVADLMLVIKSPNGKILNLSNLIGGQNDVGVDFKNTNFSSAAGLPALSTGTSPGYTGTFRPDAAGAVAAFGLPGGPTGFLPNVNTFAGLGTVGAEVNGEWTIAMYDAGPPDEGKLVNWSVSITWGVTPATAVFSPNTNLYLDAALTMPYAGTAVSSVYTNTPVSTTYNAVVSTSTCSASVSIPVSVNTPAAGSPTLNNTSVCVGSNTFLKLGGTLTGGPGFIHNFQVRVPGATSFTNITAGGVYSVNRDTLKLSEVPLSFNGYQFRDSVSTGANCGSVISTVATLTVNPIPVVRISVAPRRNLFPGLTTTLTAAVSSATGPITYQWFRNGVAVPGATNSTLVVGIDGVGTYTVRVTAQGCSSADSTTTPQTIIIGDSTGVTKLFIYPSPNNGKFQVRYFSDINIGAKNPAMLNVYDEKGTRVFSKFYGLSSGFQQMNVDLGAHSSGIYRVELLDLNGDRIKTGSVVVF